MILNSPLCKQVIEHLEERRSDLDSNEVDEAIEILKDFVGMEINSVNSTLIDRLMDDDKLQIEFAKCEVSDTEVNAFD